MAHRYRGMDMLPAPTLSPRYYQGASPVRALPKRQIAACQGGQHPCGDLDALGTSFCCPDDTYCVVDPLTGTKPACCAIGSVCGSSCSEDQYQCIGTSTITTVSPATTSTFPACCPRQCTETSMFGCPSSMGGGCCSYGQNCASNSQCLWTSTATSTATSLATLVAQLPAGCTTRQIACPSRVGGGCCGDTQSCTFASNGPACVDVRTTPTSTSRTPVSEDTSLSTAAKVGVAIGMVLLTSLLVGITTYACLRRRRRLASHLPSLIPGVSSPTSPNRPHRARIGALLGPRLDMTDDNTEIVASHGLRGLTEDHFGPRAVPGPFTEHDTVASATDHSPGGINPNRAVPLSPQSPDDITAPVEIDSRKRGVAETTEGRYEIDGSNPTSPFTPSPLTAGYETWGTLPSYEEGNNDIPFDEMSYVPGSDTIEYSPVKREKEDHQEG